MELRRYWLLIRRRWILILVTMVVGAAIGYEVTPRTSDYRTAAEVYVGTLSIAQDPVQLYQETGLDQVELTYAIMIPSFVIAEKAITSTEVPRTPAQAVSETKATVVPDTNLILVTVTDSDPVVAQKLANAMTTTFVDSVQSYSPTAKPASGTVPSEPAEVFEAAGLPVKPLATGLTRKMILGAVFGLVLAVLLVLMLDYLDITVKSPEELERRLDLPVLGIVPLRRSAAAKVSVG